ncbi:hypothetical protein [Methanobrevibacter gottschalkii]|uniref:hypothetical protein n=1 Tax=Methanobrevibacter gottschalkii TaxID=190974 RepID=UPI0038D18E5F
MNTKKLLIIVGIIIILMVCAFLFLNTSSDTKIGHARFTLPEGYHESVRVNSNVAETVTISNAKNKIYIVGYNEGNLNKSISEFIDKVKKNNDSVDFSKFNIKDKVIYKATIHNDNHTFFYWFVDNNHLYVIYTWNGDFKMDTIVKSIVESINPNLF